MYCKYLNNIQCEGPAVRFRFWSLQRKMYAKDVKNQQREVLAVIDPINKIAVVKTSMECHLPFLSVDHEYATFALIVFRVCDKRKRQL